ncbi:helix-turn-helix domain-containing protein [Mycobacterium marinum]|uniref:helix-turn-helix domain-containing protein n=1 Tax=Mycobacterium marinum TaxID=1781 RepID=UPI00137B48F1|nr:helix-turn-helix domain-containing protein [Mycobacterium marinum]
MRDRYRIEPTPAQPAMLTRVFGCAGVRSTMRYGCASRRIGRGWSCPTPWIERYVVTATKTNTERAWLCEVPSVVLRQSVSTIPVVCGATFSTRPAGSARAAGWADRG